jgi:outer membrane protein OmpA-like peptidoglycan-associated protein
MKTGISRLVWTVGLMSVSVAALAGEPKKAPPQEPVGFVAGAVIGGFAAGPFGAVIGAGIGTWLGSRVHRAGEAAQAEAKVAALQSDKSALLGENAALLTEKSELSDTNQALTAQLDDLSKRVTAAQAAKDEGTGAVTAQVLDGLQGDVLFRTGSAEITSDMAQQIQVLAQAVAKSPALKVRLDGYADPRGGVEVNLKLSEQRANAVRDLLVAGGINQDALEVNAYGKSQSVAQDADGYALERRVRLTLQADGRDSDVAQVGNNN